MHGDFLKKHPVKVLRLWGIRKSCLGCPAPATTLISRALKDARVGVRIAYAQMGYVPWVKPFGTSPQLPILYFLTVSK